MNTLDRAVRKLASISNAIIRWPAEQYLQASGAQQREQYEKLRPAFQARYRSLQERGETTPLWSEFNAKAESALLPYPPWSFERLPIISQTMVMTRGGGLCSQQLQELEKQFSRDTLQNWAREDAFGKPYLEAASLLTSHNTIHHLYHLSRFTKNTGANLEKMKTIIEWGGGYGNLAKLLLRRFSTNTYIIIDTPLFSCLQWLYLSTVLPDRTINFIDSVNGVIKEGMINIVPVQYRACVPHACDLFISTWAISESPLLLQDEIARHHWFGGKHILIGYQESNSYLPDADHTGKLALTDGAVIEDLPVLRGQHYAFR